MVSSTFANIWANEDLASLNTVAHINDLIMLNNSEEDVEVPNLSTSKGNKIQILDQ